jgi:hypothetical protein
VRGPDPVALMAWLDESPAVEKTSLFGTAVHAVLRSSSTSIDTITSGLKSAGHAVTSAASVVPSLEDVFPRCRRSARARGGVMRGIAAVAIKELRQMRRDRRSLLILLFIPAFFLLMFGYALNFDIRHVALAVQDRDRTEESRAVIAAFTRSSYFDRVATVERDSDIRALMDQGSIRILLEIPEGFAKQIQRGETADLQVLLNGDNANTATTVMGYVTAC